MKIEDVRPTLEKAFPNVVFATGPSTAYFRWKDGEATIPQDAFPDEERVVYITHALGRVKEQGEHGVGVMYLSDDEVADLSYLYLHALILKSVLGGVSTRVWWRMNPTIQTEKKTFLDELSGCGVGGCAVKYLICRLAIL